MGTHLTMDVDNIHQLIPFINQLLNFQLVLVLTMSELFRFLKKEKKNINTCVYLLLVQTVTVVAYLLRIYYFKS